jgi:hypothetical protein
MTGLAIMAMISVGLIALAPHRALRPAVASLETRAPFEPAADAR